MTFAVVNATATMPKSSSHASLPKVFVILNDSQVLPCGSNRRRLNACFWKPPASRGDPQVIFIDQKVAENGGWMNGNGISYINGDDPANVNCAMRLDRITKDDVGNWSCSLVLKDGEIVTEVTDIRQCNIHLNSTSVPGLCSNERLILELEPTKIYFATYEGGIQAYSVATSQVNIIVNSTEGFFGIAYDSIRNLIYWSSWNKIYRANANGSGSEIVFNATACKFSSRSSTYRCPTSRFYIPILCTCR